MIKIGLRSKLYFLASLFFLFQTATGIYFVETGFARQLFVAMPGELKFFFWLFIAMLILIVLVVIHVLLTLLNQNLGTSVSSKSFSKKTIFFFSKPFLVAIAFAASLTFFNFTALATQKPGIGHVLFINYFLFSFLASFLISDLFNPVEKQISFYKKRKYSFPIWFVITIIMTTIISVVLMVL
ncbi:MAG: hypothetical protein HOE11_04220 [Candidatus Diapherotrites archaeon]|nr:hypothetical protein [Candidatus Diapherotrites archaeon]